MPFENIMLHILRVSVCVQPLLSYSYSSDCRQNILDMGWHLYGIFFFELCKYYGNVFGGTPAFTATCNCLLFIKSSWLIN